jgi:hypothetical protein
MRGLDRRKYIAVTFENKAISPWIVDQSKIKQIKLNAKYLNQVREQFNNSASQDVLQTSLAATAPSSSAIELEEVTHSLGIMSQQISVGGLLDFNHHQEMLSKVELALPAERFYGRPYVNLGSSRHALAWDMQLKGVGFNQLCLNGDFHHRWGGFIVRDALKAFLSDIVASKRTKLGTLHTAAAFIYHDHALGKIPLALQLRDAQSYRLAQVHPDFTPQQDKEVVRQHLCRYFHTQDPELMLQTICEHYTHAVAQGIHFRSISFDNLTVDGRFLDCESIDFTTDHRPVPRFVILIVPNQHVNRSLADLRLAEALQQFPDSYFGDSLVHHIYNLTYLTEYIYRSIWPELGFCSLQEVKNQVRKHLPGLATQEDFDLLDTYQSSTLTTFLGLNQDQLHRVKSQDLKGMGHFVYNHHYPYPFSDATAICFTENMRQDLKYECNQILKKWEVLFWPHQEELNWDNAFLNYQKMYQSVD